MTLAANTPSASADKALGRAFCNTAWRCHFYAGRYVAPFLIMLAITVLIMLWSSVFVGRDGEKLYSVTTAAQTVAAGSTAGLDLGLDIVARLRGEEAAKRIQLIIEYDPHPSFDAGSPEKAGPEITNFFLKARQSVMGEAKTAALRAAKRFKT